MSELEQALEHCLSQLNRGEATLEDCIADYPEHADELRRLILTAIQVEQHGRAVRPEPQFKSQARAQLLAHMEKHPRSGPAKGWFGLSDFRFGLAIGRAFNVAAGLAAVILLVFLTGTVLAQTALPGEPLYSWRRISEKVWLAFQPDPLRAELALAARHARDLSQVAGNPQAEPAARQGYQQSLNQLAIYADPTAQVILSEGLSAQKATLEEARVTVPELEELLQKVTIQEAHLSVVYAATEVESGVIIHSLAVTNLGPASPVTATLVSSYEPAEAVASVEGPGCYTSDPTNGSLVCEVGDLALDTSRIVTLTGRIAPCYSGSLINTITVTGAGNVVNVNLDNQITAENEIPVSFPNRADIVYVQSNGPSHELGLANSAGQVLDHDLHVRAAAPAWSPDGSKLAFFGEEGISELGAVYSQGNGLWVIDAGSGQAQNPRQLVAQDHLKNIAWSPDGTKLAFELGPPDQDHRIVVVDSRDGREISSIAGEQPAWSADSQKLAIKGCAPACGLWQVNFDGSEPQQLTFEATDSYPAWSPTGEYLVFTSNRDGNWEIYRLDLADGQLRRLTNRPGSDITPVFGPCGQNIYLRTDQFGSWWITVMELDGSDERKVLEGVGPSDDWGLARPAVH